MSLSRYLTLILIPIVCPMMLGGCVSLVTPKMRDTPFTEKRKEILREPFDHQEFVREVEAEIAKEKEEKTWDLSIQKVTTQIVQNNINIKISHLDLDKAQRDVTKEEAVFDPKLTYATALARARTPPTLPGPATLTDTVGWDWRYKQKVITGGDYTVSLDHDRSGNKHAFTTSLGGTISQPLLANLGSEVTLANLRISRNSYNIAIEDLKSSMIDEISSAQNAYWEILHAQEVVTAKRVAYRQAMKLVEQNKKEQALGSRTYTDVLEAEATAASREEEVLQAENSLKSKEDDLKKLLNVDQISLWDARISLADRIDSSFVPIPVNFRRSIHQAFRNRPDFHKALEKLKNEHLNFVVARNAILPDLSLDYTYQYNGAGESSRDSVNRLKNFDYPDWSLSLTFSTPWLDRSDRANYQQKKDNLKRQELTVKDLALRIIKEVRSAIREVQTDIKRVRTAELAYQLQAKKVEAEEKKFALGLSTNFQVLEFQEDLANASVTRSRAVIDYRESVINLWKVLGNTLEQNGIVFEENQAAGAAAP